jgi:hypothetical protein
LTNRYNESLDCIPAAQMLPRAEGDHIVYVGNRNRTKDLDANNAFLAQYGLELVPVNRPMEWLVMDHVKKQKTPNASVQSQPELELESPSPDQ